MNSQRDALPDSKIATGLKYAALVVVLALIAVMAHPGPGLLMSTTVVSDVPHTVAAAPAGSDTEYFPARFAAPVETSEQPSTF